MSVKSKIRAFGTQEEVAQKMGVSRQSIKVWVRKDSVPLSRVKKLSEILGCKPEELNPDLRSLVQQSSLPTP